MPARPRHCQLPLKKALLVLFSDLCRSSLVVYSPQFSWLKHATSTNTNKQKLLILPNLLKCSFHSKTKLFADRKLSFYLDSRYRGRVALHVTERSRTRLPVENFSRTPLVLQQSLKFRDIITVQTRSSHYMKMDTAEAVAKEEQHVHKVYQEIAEHFSNTRYKVSKKQEAIPRPKPPLIPAMADCRTVPPTSASRSNWARYRLRKRKVPASQQKDMHPSE